ncbi:MAG TPA: nuclear transport factor 2 family protein [Chloroflexia bacterium]|nr:nuclear transport factor 2 family protein [Chloroflexia bacterium]
MKRLVCILTLVSAFALLAAPGRTYAQASDPAAVVLAGLAAFNAGNIDAIMALFADNAVLTVNGGGPGGQPLVATGKDQIRAGTLAALSQHQHIVIESIQVDGDHVHVLTMLSTDALRQAGFAALESMGDFVVQNGKIVSQTLGLTPASLAKLQAAAGAGPGMPATGAPDGRGLGAALALGLLALLAGHRLRRAPGAAAGR